MAQEHRAQRKRGGVGGVRSWAAAVLGRAWELWACELSDDDLGRPAIVFAPHPDDETLGCGGTIARKRRAGARVSVVFMTDGSGSHRGSISPQRLQTLRWAEAHAAARVLGLASEDLVFLAYEDGRLADHARDATDQVADLLATFRPEQVYVPDARDGPPDHEATWRIVRRALRAYGARVTVYAYPVWLWNRWPWVRALPRPHALRLLTRFHHRVRIGEVLDVKRSALEQHRSQLHPLAGGGHEATLGSVKDGEFLDCFFRDWEPFYRYSDRSRRRLGSVGKLRTGNSRSARPCPGPGGA